MSTLLDSSFMIAFFNIKDINHETAKKIMQKLKEGVYGKLFISDYIFDEFVTLAAKRARPDLAVEWGQMLLESDKIGMLNIDKQAFTEAWNLFRTTKGFSFTDCTLVSVAAQFSIGSIVSFDSDFDKTKSIQRIYAA